MSALGEIVIAVLLVIGGGYIGCELGQMFARAGVKVTLVCRSHLLAEAEPEIAPHHPQPGRSSAARPWREIVARSFNLKG